MSLATYRTYTIIANAHMYLREVKLQSSSQDCEYRAKIQHTWS
jgi:hypothetical protein